MVNSQIGRFQNGNGCNDTSFRGCSQSQFNYQGQVPHHGRYAGGRYVPDQTSGTTIPAVRPFHQPQPVSYCKICEVKLPSYKNVEEHNNGKKHRRKLGLHKELERLKMSNGQIPKSQVNLVVQPKTDLKSWKNGCPEKNVSSEATVARHRNYLQKDTGVAPEVPAEGKPRINTSAQGHNLKRKIGESKISKYMKTNDGLRRSMESSKRDTESMSYSIESPVKIPVSTPRPAVASAIMAPSPVVKSNLKLVYQQVLASESQVFEAKEDDEIQNPIVETNDHSHAPADSNIYTQPEDLSFDSAAKATRPPKEGYCTICKVHLPNCKTSEMHKKEKSHKKMLRHKNVELKLLEEIQSLKTSNGQIPNYQSGTESQLSIDTAADCENQNCTDEKNNQLVLLRPKFATANALPSVLAEFNSSSGSTTNTQTADECSKAEQRMDILTHHQSGPTQLSQVAVCLQCGDVGFPEALVYCNKCKGYAVHRYCLAGPVIFTDPVTWHCEDCEPNVEGPSFHDSCSLLPSGKIVSLNLGNDTSQSTKEPKGCIESVKNKQEPENIAAKTVVQLPDNRSLSHHGLSQCSNNSEKENKVLLPDNHSLSPHVLSQCSTNSEKENKFEKECQPVPHPIADPVWRGSLCIFDPSFGTLIGLLAHMSTLACNKAQEESRLFPNVLFPNLLPRTRVWPNSFLKCGPNMNSIALYLFPDSESAERDYDKLVEDLIYFDLSIKAVVENAELLIFPSILLPMQCRRYQEKYYLWGVFRAKKLSE